MKNKRFRDAMPSSWGRGHRAPESDYVFKILATIEYDWLYANVARIVSEREQRRIVEQPKVLGTLQISSNWASLLMSQPLDPCK